MKLDFVWFLLFYGWQNIGEYLTLKSRRSPCLGIMNQINILEAYVSSQSINSDVITCIDAFFYSR